MHRFKQQQKRQIQMSQHKLLILIFVCIYNVYIGKINKLNIFHTKTTTKLYLALRYFEMFLLRLELYLASLKILI